MVAKRDEKVHKGVLAAQSSRPSATKASGRICAQDGCDTRLSVYNGQDRCALHSLFNKPRMRGRTSSESGGPQRGR